MECFYFQEIFEILLSNSDCWKQVKSGNPSQDLVIVLIIEFFLKFLSRVGFTPDWILGF